MIIIPSIQVHEGILDFDGQVHRAKLVHRMD